MAAAGSIATAVPQTLGEGVARAKSKMGVEVCQMLEFVSAKLLVIEERLTKRVCKKCAEGVVMGRATPKPIEGARPGPGLLAKLLVDKYDEPTPLYRQAKE